jgi:hypothetical protein
MPPITSYIVPTVVGIGLILGGSLMLVRPELCRGVPPDPTLTRRGIRTGGLVLLLLGICWLLHIIIVGPMPCGPNECVGF